MALIRFLHILAVVIWVGGMFFAYFALRPVAGAVLDPAQRLPLWRGVLTKFFAWVWASVAVVLATGLYMMAQQGAAGGAHVHTMLAIGIVMMAIFGHVYFAPFARLKTHVHSQDWKSAGAALNQIRILVAANLGLGLVNIAVAVIGRTL